MAELDLILRAKTRQEKKKKVNYLRQQGKIPAVLYGHKIKPVNLALDYSNFEKVFKQAGESTLVDLVVDDARPVKVLVQDYQADPVTDRFIHVDFHQVKMDEKITTEIPLKFIGEAPAVKEIGGVLVTSLDTLQVECLPQDLVTEIEVDLSSLNEFDTAIHVSEIKIPPGITIKSVATEVIVLIQAPRTEKELEFEEIKPEAEAVEGEEAEAAEGEEAEAESETPAAESKDKVKAPEAKKKK